MLSAAQKQARLGRVTSSVAAAALKLHPYMGPQTAQALILGEAPERQNPALERYAVRGSFCEPACLTWAAGEVGAAWRPAPFVAHANGWSGDSADALFEDEQDELVAVGEAKTVSARTAHLWRQEGTDECPDHVIVQCCWHLYHWPQAPRVYVPVLMAGWEFEFRLYVVERNDILIQSLVSEAREWYERHILQREPVPPTELDEDLVRSRFARVRTPQTPLTERMRELALRKVSLRKQRQELEAEETRVSTQLRELLGDSGYAGDDTLSITCRERATSRVSWRDAQQALGLTAEQLAPFTTTTTTRALTVNAK